MHFASCLSAGIPGIRCLGVQLSRSSKLPAQVTTGVTSDLRQASRYARHMVAECGMSDELVRRGFTMLSRRIS